MRKSAEMRKYSLAEMCGDVREYVDAEGCRDTQLHKNLKVEERCFELWPAHTQS